MAGDPAACDRGVAGPRNDPTGMFMPGSVPVTAADWRRKRIAINVSFLWLLVPLVDLAGAHPAPARAALAVAAAALFVVLYNRLPRERRPPRLTSPVTLSLALMVTITIVLTVAERDSWGLLFVFTAIAGVMRLSRRDGVLWVIFCTALTGATLVVTHSDGARGARATGGLGGTCARRARPARPARPQPLGHRREG
jgi:hypothetical protein